MKQIFSVVCRCQMDEDNAWEISFAGACEADHEANNLPVGMVMENIYASPMSLNQLGHWETDTRFAYWKVVEVQYDWESGECS